jgi:hypothetical protein
VIAQSGYRIALGAKPDSGKYLRNVATWLMEERPHDLLIMPDLERLDTYPMGAYLAVQAALTMDVEQVNGPALIEREWNQKDAGRFYTSRPFLLVWGFGGDLEHVWLRTLYYRVLFARRQHGRPTVVAFAPGGELEVTRLYGLHMASFLSTQKRLV